MGRDKISILGSRSEAKRGGGGGEERPTWRLKTREHRDNASMQAKCSIHPWSNL